MDTEKTTVKDYMTKNVYTVRYDTLNKDVIALMKETKHDGYPVVDEDKHIVGIITAYDLLLKDWETEFVSGIMSKEVIVAREDMHINDASRVMFRHGISRLPVVDKERHVKGIMTNTDIVLTAIVSDGTVEFFDGSEWVIGKQYTVSNNGIYKFRVTDIAGNVTKANYNVTNIDKVFPVFEEGYLIQNSGNYTFYVNFSASDNETTLDKFNYQIKTPKH